MQSSQVCRRMHQPNVVCLSWTFFSSLQLHFLIFPACSSVDFAQFVNFLLSEDILKFLQGEASVAR
jgi:hypothetical protein